MRVFGVSEKWGKLHLELPASQRPPFSTFRLPRKDADRGLDWKEGETLQIVFKPRSPRREVLGPATITAKSSQFLALTHDEAQADGFEDQAAMLAWFKKTHGAGALNRHFNKLTFRWEAK